MAKRNSYWSIVEEDLKKLRVENAFLRNTLGLATDALDVAVLQIESLKTDVAVLKEKAVEVKG